MSAISLGLALVAPASHANLDPDRRALINQSCREVAQWAVKTWANIEDQNNITCLRSNYISPARYDEMMIGFQQECADANAAQLAAGRDQSADQDIRFSPRKVTKMFVNHYNSVFVEFCSTKNPGKGINTQPARSPDRGRGSATEA